MKPLWMKNLVKTIFGSVIKSKYKPTVSRTLQIEPLEIRLTPTDVSNVCGTLFVTGTSGDDNTFIWLDGTDLNIAEPSALGANLRGNAFNSAFGGSQGVTGANGVLYDVLTNTKGVSLTGTGSLTTHWNWSAPCRDESRGAPVKPEGLDAGFDGMLRVYAFIILCRNPHTLCRNHRNTFCRNHRKDR